MPSHAVDEAWHGLILCTARYAAFCDRAYGRFLHHRPDGDTPAADSMAEQLRRTVIAWSLVAEQAVRAVTWTAASASSTGVSTRKTRQIDEALANLPARQRR